MNVAVVRSSTHGGPFAFDLYVRGEVPAVLAGSLLVPTTRRNKDRRFFSRWHDSQTDLMRLDLFPGRPGRVKAHVLAVDPSGADLGEGFRRSEFEQRAYGQSAAYGYATQPNHAVNVAGDTLWATNLLFGAPLEVDLKTWKPRRILRYVEPHELAPRVSGTAHFAWSLDRRYAYLQQSLLRCESPDAPVLAQNLCLVRLDVRSGAERVWRLIPPPEDDSLASANFHSAFYFEEAGRRYVGLLRTGAVLESLTPHSVPIDHPVAPIPLSTVWIVPLDDGAEALQAELLPGIRELGGFALSHLDVDATGGDGFILYANFKQSDVAEETHGPNIYGEDPDQVAEHYAGMVVEALNYGLVIRYERRHGKTTIRSFRRPYDPGKTSLGHSWLPINIELDPSRRRLFCTFSGFRPRLLSQYVAATYPGHVVDPATIRYVPPLLMRFDAATLEPEDDPGRGHLSYAEPIAMTVAGDGRTDYVFTFSPEIGLRIYRADDLTRMVCHAESPSLMHWRDSHFRPDPAHLEFVAR